MSWRKHLAAVPQGAKLQAAIQRLHRDIEAQGPMASGSKYLSYLPEVYAGQPNRLERYSQYDCMDKDPEVNAAVDTIADFGTLGEEAQDTPFKIVYYGEPTGAESDILVEALNKWSRMNAFKRRLWRIFRSTIMYGDQFFIRDPETFEWFWVNHEKVESITVNEAEGKTPQYYNIQDLDLNVQTLVATLPTKNPNRGLSGWAGGNIGTAKNPGPISPPHSGAGTGFAVGQGSVSVDATHVIHLSLSEGLDANWPFGSSILEAIFKPYKQKELLEDSIIIYRVQRAPERRVFYIDVGNAPTYKAMEFVNRIKNEIHQRRIPSTTGGGTSIMDSAYNPLCLSLDTTVPLLDGRTLSLKELISEYNNGKENWTYSCDPITGKIVPGNITWAGITRKDTQVIKLYLDDGSTVTVTPAHKIPVLGKGFVEAQHLTDCDSLISFKSREQSLVSSDNERTYTQVYDHELNDWIYTHRMVGNFFKHINKHQEFTYLEENKSSHKKEEFNHRVVKIEWLTEKQDTGTITIDGQEQWHNYHTFPVNNCIYVKNSIIEDYFFPQTCLSTTTSIPLLDGRTLTLADIINEYNQGKVNWVYGLNNKTHELEPAEIKWAGITRKNAEVVKVILDNGEEVIATPDHRFITRNGKEIEAKDLTPGQSLMPFLHNSGCSVVSVEFLEERIDTGDITIESESNSHWFGLGAGIYVHNSEGRGSKVETLPGGENLGEIDDLKYFNNKLLRGLRVPPSYLPFGPDDSSAVTYSDGRVGTAYMQEFRFAKYVKRLQNLINHVFDREFKLFLRQRGVQIDSALFEIEIHEPQNFSKFRQLEIDAAQINTMQPLADLKFFSKRFLLKRYLGMTEDEIAENERLWKEENPRKTKPVGAGSFGSSTGDVGGLGDVGLRPRDEDAGVGLGDEGEPIEDMGGESPISGAEAGEPAPAPGGELKI